MDEYTYMNREFSWLSFNGRVLQEAKDPTVPLYERIKFLAIFSSNLDEFYRVRVASIRSLLRLGTKTSKKLDFDPGKLLKSINAVVRKQQTEFGEVFRSEILPGLKDANISIVTGHDLTADQSLFVCKYFEENILAAIKPQFLGVGQGVPFLQNRMLYLACALQERSITVAAMPESGNRQVMALVPIPTHVCPRFVSLPNAGEKHCIIFLDDILRHCFDRLFPEHVVVESCAIKLTRDAELYIDDEFTGNLLEKIKAGLERRSAGVPSRFLYDGQMSRKSLKFLRRYLDIHKDDAIPGGRYHNFSDFFGFPNPGVSGMENEPLELIPSQPLSDERPMFEVIKEQDVVLYYPYHDYESVIRFLNEAAEDPGVTAIDITLYRVSSNSQVCEALISAARQGKAVNAFIEVKARFDEESNLVWAEALSNAGVKTHYSTPGIKVHSKLLVVTREERGETRRYAYLSTGNFNEKTSRVYTDFGLFTADEDIATEAAKAFTFIIDREQRFVPSHLLVAQLNMRQAINECIKKEIATAAKGEKASILLKLNSIEDRKLIDKLYEASNAGVNITIIVRGICCLVPGVKDQSENINVISIVDRYLEHPRVYVFHNGGDERMFVSSADWMTRNMNRRIEVGFPVYDDRVRNVINGILALQLQDNVKARIINKRQSNPFVKQKPGAPLLQSQIAIHAWLKEWEETGSGSLPGESD